MPPVLLSLRDNTPRTTAPEESRNLLSKLSVLARHLDGPHLARRAAGGPRALSTLSRHFRRQSTDTSNNANNGIIPSAYSPGDFQSPGTVVGIVLGSVFGFLLILWLIWTCFNLQNANSAVTGEEIIRERRPSSRRVVQEVIEVDRSPRRPERVIVEERRRSIVDSDDEIIEVIEERSSPRRQRSRRSSHDRPRSGIRYVDPDLPAGGDGRVEEVFIRKQSRKSRGR